jgi:hypothetical protein
MQATQQVPQHSLQQTQKHIPRKELVEPFMMLAVHVG